MNRLRSFLFAAIVVISGASFALGGDMQTPGIANPTPTPTPTASTSYELTQSKSTEEAQIVWQDATKLLLEILLTIF